MNKSCEAASYYKFYIYDNKISDKKYSSDAYINHPAYNRESLRPIILLVCNEGTFDYPQEIEAKLDSNVKLSHYIPRFKKMKYIYDFGDEWQHYIVVEKIVEGYTILFASAEPVIHRQRMLVESLGMRNFLRL